MKRIKDFIYNQNDLVIALIIILLAGSLIYSRMNRILDYPMQVAAASEQAGQQTNVPDSNPQTGSEEQTPPEVTPQPGTSGTDGTTGSEEQTPPEVTPQPGTPGTDAPTGGEEQTPQPQTPPEVTPQPQTPPEVTPQPDGPITFAVESGRYKGWTALAADLQKAGVIDSAEAFMKVVWARNSAGTLGSFYTRTYTFERGLTYDEVIDIINKKK